jgi:hypothetical protein
MSKFPAIRFATSVGLLLLLAADAAAQYGVKKQPAPKLPPGRIAGEVKGQRSGALMVSDGNQAYFVQVAADAKKVDVKGEADMSILQPGMFIRFDIKMDKQGNGKEDIQKIELFTYDPQVARTGTEKKTEEEFTIAGRLSSITKAGKITVAIPGEKLTVKGQIAKDATLDVGVRGSVWLKLAKVGDSATASGKVAKPSLPNNPGVLIADELEVKLLKLPEDEFGKAKPEKKPKAAEKKAAEKE